MSVRSASPVRFRSSARHLIVHLIWCALLLLAGGGGLLAQSGETCPDADHDFYADCTVEGCTPVPPCGDCDDSNPAIHPDALEICNYRDDDCNGASDEGFPKTESRSRWIDPERQDGDGVGKAVAGLGDVTGDGVPDFAIGASRTPFVGTRNSVMIVSGADGSLWCRILDTGSGTYFGDALAGIGDITGDGIPDLAVGRPAYSGAVLLYSGADCHELASCEDSAAGDLGFSLAALPDLNGDGFPEIAAGAPRTDIAGENDAGRVYIFTYDGSQCLTLLELDNPVGDVNDNLGSGVAAAPDLDGDGVPEIIAGASGTKVDSTNSAGSVSLFSGADGSFIRSMTDPEPTNYERMGSSVTALPDVDADGIRDIAAGAPGWDDDKGSVLFFSGTDGSFICRAESAPGVIAKRLGESIALVGDLDEDATPDLAAGAPRSYNSAKLVTGMVAVLSTGACAMTRALFDPQAQNDDRLGTSVANVGDINGDRVDDIVAGARYADNGVEVDVGAVYLFIHESDCDDDGFGPWGGDCDDGAAQINPARMENCTDGTDDNCDGLIDCQDALFCAPDPGPTPGEIVGLAVGADKQTLEWEADPVADVYDLLEGPVEALLAVGSFEDARCLAWRVPETFYQDPAVPEPGSAGYYLVRGKADVCRIGSWGSTLRDEQANACP